MQDCCSVNFRSGAILRKDNRFLHLRRMSTCMSISGKRKSARDAKIVFERRHEVVALHEQLGRGVEENHGSIANETGRTVRLKSS